jgi:hypothetical protein
MIRLSKAPVPFPLPWAPDVHFHIRPGNIIERGELEADLAEHRAGRVFDFQMQEAFEDGVRTLLAGDDEAATRLIEAYAAEDQGEDLSAEDRAGLEMARDALRSSWPAYRTLLAQAARRNELIPTFAFQRFVTGWEGDGLPQYRKGVDGKVDLEVMAKVEPIAVRIVGLRAYQMLYAAGDEGNSERPSPSVESPPHSESDTPKKVGSSAKRSGKRTRSSRSARRSSPSSTSGSTVVA